MRPNRILFTLLAGSLLGGLAIAAPAMTRRGAIRFALEQVPGGKLLSAEREHEGGKDIWSVDVRSADGKHEYEFEYEVSTGRLLSRKEESEAERRRETAAEKKRTPRRPTPVRSPSRPRPG